jgi:hypothetical protein
MACQLLQFFFGLRGCIWRMALILLGLASKPLVETKQPSTLPRVCDAFWLLATTMSSTYESKFLPTWSFSAAFIILQKVGPALRHPSGILR